MTQLSITNFVRIYQKNTTCYLLIEKERIKYGRDVEKKQKFKLVTAAYANGR